MARPAMMVRRHLPAMRCPLTKVWGPEYRDDRDYLWAYVRDLRRKLEPDPERPVHIRSEPGFGYVLDCPPPVPRRICQRAQSAYTEPPFAG